MSKYFCTYVGAIFYCSGPVAVDDWIRQLLNASLDGVKVEAEDVTPGQEGPSPPVYTPPPIPSGYPGPSNSNSNEVDTVAPSPLPPDVMLITRAKVHEAAMQATPKAHISYTETSEGPSHTPLWTVRCLGMSIHRQISSPCSPQPQSTAWSKGQLQPEARMRARTSQLVMPTFQWVGIALATTEEGPPTILISNTGLVSPRSSIVPPHAHDLHAQCLHVWVQPCDGLGGARNNSPKKSAARTSPSQLCITHTRMYLHPRTLLLGWPREHLDTLPFSQHRLRLMFCASGFNAFSCAGANGPQQEHVLGIYATDRYLLCIKSGWIEIWASLSSSPKSYESSFKHVYSRLHSWLTAALGIAGR